jgi:hypothetical protein
MRGDGNALWLFVLLGRRIRSIVVPAMPKHPPSGSTSTAPPVSAEPTHSASATSLVTFTALTEAQWQAIRSTPNDWPDGTDWRGRIEQVGRQVWERWAERETWLAENLRGKPPTEERKKVEGVLRLTRQLQKAWADSSLDEADLPDPGLKLREQRAEVWLYLYGSHVSPFTSKRDPIQDELECQLMLIWVEAGGELSYSRKKDDSTTPYSALVDFLTLTLEAITGKTYQPSGIADIIDKHRAEIMNARGMRR